MAIELQVRFWNHAYDFKPNYTPFRSITIINSLKYWFCVNVWQQECWFYLQKGARCWFQAARKLKNDDFRSKCLECWFHFNPWRKGGSLYIENSKNVNFLLRISSKMSMSGQNRLKCWFHVNVWQQGCWFHLQYWAKVMQTIIDKYRALFSRFITDISAKHCMDCRMLKR